MKNNQFICSSCGKFYKSGGVPDSCPKCVLNRKAREDYTLQGKIVTEKLKEYTEKLTQKLSNEMKQFYETDISKFSEMLRNSVEYLRKEIIIN